LFGIYRWGWGFLTSQDFNGDIVLIACFASCWTGHMVRRWHADPFGFLRPWNDVPALIGSAPPATPPRPARRGHLSWGSVLDGPHFELSRVCRHDRLDQNRPGHRHDHSILRDDPAERRYQAPLYLFPQMSLYASGFCGTALGIARAMLASFTKLAVDKRPPLAKRTLRDTGMVQYEVAQAEARMRAARAFVLSELSDIWQEVVATMALSIANRMRIRLATTFAIHEAKAAADTAYDLAGATAIFISNDFERRFRDIHTVTQQQQGRKAHLQSVGAFLLGLPPDLDIA
jgi:hypothetical protein